MASMKLVYEKVDRAYDNLQSLVGEIRLYVDGKPSRVVGDAKQGGNRLRLRFEKCGQPPSRVGYLAGLCIQDLRSSLDYLIEQLVLGSDQEPIKRNQFPICTSRELFEKELRGHRLDGIEKDAITVVESLQPYHPDAKRTDHHPLFVLNELANINKHRRPLVSVLNILPVKFEFSGPGGSNIQAFGFGQDETTCVGVGPPMGLGEKVDVKGHAVLSVVFDERFVKGVEVCQCLGILGYTVRDVVLPRFERFLGKS